MECVLVPSSLRKVRFEIAESSRSQVLSLRSLLTLSPDLSLFIYKMRLYVLRGIIGKGWSAMSGSQPGLVRPSEGKLREPGF